MRKKRVEGSPGRWTEAHGSLPAGAASHTQTPASPGKDLRMHSLEGVLVA